MRYLLIILLFSSCLTVNKAVNKVASTPKFTPEQENLLAAKYAILFPTKEWTTQGEVTVDSTAFKKAVAQMEQDRDAVAEDIMTLMRLIDSTGTSNESLVKVVDSLRARLSKKQSEIDIVKSGKIPCPERLKTDTTFKKVTSELVVAENKLKVSNADNAVKDVQIATKDEVIRTLEAQVKVLKDRPSKWWLWLLIGTGVGFGGSILLRLKRII